MTEPSTHINYTFEDVQRYLHGKMSAAEMHAVEKAALQDTFLADAIEGYREVSTTTAQQHVNEINAALQTKEKDAKVVSIKRNYQWLRIAAIILLLAGVGVIGTYFFKTSDKQQQIAQVKNEPANKSNTIQDSTEAIMPETSLVIKKVIAQNNKRQTNQSFKKEERSQSKLYADTIAEDETATASVTAASSAQNNEASKSLASVPLSTQKNNDSIQNFLQGKVSGVNIAANTFAGEVIDEDKKPVAGAVVETNDKKKAAVTDINGNFSLQKNDSMLNVTATTVGYENKNALLKPNDTNVIILRESTSALNDVVVTGYGVKKNKSAKQTAMPVGGWQNFNDYVINQLNKDSTNKESYISNNDVVELEFLIDTSGNPYNIHITKSLDEEKNSKAIDILKSGPKWINTSKYKKVKVAIAFYTSHR